MERAPTSATLPWHETDSVAAGLSSPPQPARTIGTRSQTLGRTRIQVSIHSAARSGLRDEGPDSSPAPKHAKHFAVLALPPIIVHDQNSPDRGGNPSQQRQLQAQAERRLENTLVQQQRKPGKQDGNSDHRRSFDVSPRRTVTAHREFCLARRQARD
jgi:hypothetical protein